MTSKFNDLLEKWINSQNLDLVFSILELSEKSIIEYKITDKEVWFKFLNSTYKPQFQQVLETQTNRNRWVNVVFKAIQNTNYGFKDMFECRVNEHPKRFLFQDMASQKTSNWSYEQINRQIREFATIFHHAVPNDPRIAIFSQNRLESAVCDLACLMYDIFDTPLNIHFDKQTIIYILDVLKINIIVVDTKQRLQFIEEILHEQNLNIKIFTILPESKNGEQVPLIQELCKQLSDTEITEVLGKRKIKNINQVGTTMFTSGSTGLPKGVSFSNYNLVSKRFARGAALPKIGDGETMICYLPLFHTFGRFLEMMGTIYWNGTYVFVGNTSKETLLRMFPEINPSIFISIPLRWVELYETCIAETENILEEEFRLKRIREIVGQNLKWGLSAAGYLEPKIFKYFQNHGVELGSGFGMTEASGGITMTPPGDYVENSVGKPLPGVNTKLGENGELFISGHYIARYLEDAAPNQVIDFPISAEKDYWLPTGDIFEIAESGHHEIVDRLKDIYKNNKGQTVAPRNVEKKFVGVPGIKNTFLVGDARPYNVLLIVPDNEDTVLQAAPDKYHEEYFHQIVMQANKDLAPYERVVNFTILNRNFSEDKGELTPKGSFNRKQIEKNFIETIDKLYTSNNVVIEANDFNIIIPRWFYRDLGILETDIYYKDDYLVNRVSNTNLIFKSISDQSFLIGDFIYTTSNKSIDIGLFTRQPNLWLGNLELVKFCPLKEGWDIPLKNKISVSYYYENKKIYTQSQIPVIKGLRDNRLNEVNKYIALALFAENEMALEAIKYLGKLLNDYERFIANTIRKRLETLANSPFETIRVLTYQILLLDDPNPDYNASFSAFIKSGKTFLNQESINYIAKSNLGKQHLQSLRQRLHTYRNQIDMQMDSTTVLQFENILMLLFNFASNHFEYYQTVRAEFASWIMNRKSPQISEVAKYYLNKLGDVFDNYIEKKLNKFSTEQWHKFITFGNGIANHECERLISIFESSYYLQKSVILTFSDFDFNMSKIQPNGLWIIKLIALREFNHYRISINTIDNKHYDLHLVVSEKFSPETSKDTFYWMSSLAGYPFDSQVVPALGYSWSQLGILTTQYIGGLTVWDKIREYSEIHKSAGHLTKKNAWKKLFIKAFEVFFKAWRNSGYKIVPGLISTPNVVVPELDFRENGSIVSISGWKNVTNILDIFEPMLQEFYNKTAALYPWSKPHLDVNWIFDACIEALGNQKANKIFDELKNLLEKSNLLFFNNNNLLDSLNLYIAQNTGKYYLPLALTNAIDQYSDWKKMNNFANAKAKEQTIFELIELYKLNSYKEVVRYELYRKTYFDDCSDEIKLYFEQLTEKMKKESDILPVQFIELSELQSVIHDKEDKKIFSKMVFPTILSKQKIDILKVGEKRIEHLIVNSEIKDNTGLTYNFREPIEPSEVGLLYQLFYKENYPKEISEEDQHLIMFDKNEQIVGGLSYKNLEDKTVLLDGTVVISVLQGRGIGSAMIEDFFTRMASQGVKIIKAHFLFGNYYLKHNFKVDKNWGALVRFL